MLRVVVLASVSVALSMGAACGAPTGPRDYQWFDGTDDTRPAGRESMRLRWSKRLTGDFDQPYIPVEHASAGLDPIHDRVYIGSAGGGFFAFSSSGRLHFRYDAESGVEAAPAVDETYGDVFLASEDGVIHALRGRTGSLRWKEESGGPVRQPPLLGEDVVYVVTEDDKVVALSRDDGEILWNYDREVDSEYAIAGHAGIRLHEDKVITGFTDGTIVALNANDGTVSWERPTSLDYEPDESEALRFFDVDTTPVVVGDTVYAASFTTGLYAMNVDNGTVLWREPRKGITGLAGNDRFLVVASADEGLYALTRDTREVVWERGVDEGAPGQPLIHGRVVLVGQSHGALLSLAIRSGRELSRIDAGTGFSAPVSVAGSYGFVLSNGGTLFAFSL